MRRQDKQAEEADKNPHVSNVPFLIPKFNAPLWHSMIVSERDVMQFEPSTWYRWLRIRVESTLKGVTLLTQFRERQRAKCAHKMQDLSPERVTICPDIHFAKSCPGFDFGPVSFGLDRS